MYMTDIPSSRFKSRMLLKIVALRDASTMETGSSASIIRGCSTRALATITLCRCPPLS